MDLALRGEGPAAMNLGAVTALMGLKLRQMSSLREEMYGELEGLHGTLPLFCQAAPALPLEPFCGGPCPGFQHVSSPRYRCLWPFLIGAEPGHGVSGLAGPEGGGLLSPSLCVPVGKWALFFWFFSHLSPATLSLGDRGHGERKRK